MARNYQLIIALLASSACAQMANADVAASNAIYTSNQTATPSQTVTIPINMKNSVEATAYSFSIKLPDGVENVVLSKSTARKTNNVVFDHAVQSDNSIMALCYTTDGEPFEGADGEVAIVTFDVPATMAAGNYDIVIKESEISESGIAHCVNEGVSSELTVTAPITGEITLVDGEPYTQEENQQFAKITYKRTFNPESVETWQDIYLPFSFDIAAHPNLDVAEIFVVAPLVDTNGNGVLDGDDALYVVLSKKTSGMTQPNAPYMVYPKRTRQTITATNTTLYAAESRAVDFSTSRKAYTVNGVYDTKTIGPSDHCYWVDIDGAFSYVSDSEVSVGPYHFYMQETVKNSVYDDNSSSHSRMRIAVLGEDIDEETALQFIQADAIQSCAGTDNVIYNLNGVRVDDSNSLPAGIYVKNGKTFMIR